VNEDLLRALAHDLGADTADCPTLVHRVAAGVARRRRRQRVVASGFVAIAVAVAGPAVVLDRVGGSRTDDGAAVLCGGAVADCGQILSARAQQALRRANSPDFASHFGSLVLSNASPTDSCLHRAYCRGPV
jgi:hypothetical protein